MKGLMILMISVNKSEGSVPEAIQRVLSFFNGGQHLKPVLFDLHNKERQTEAVVSHKNKCPSVISHICKKCMFLCVHFSLRVGGG